MQWIIALPGKAGAPLFGAKVRSCCGSSRSGRKSARAVDHRAPRGPALWGESVRETWAHAHARREWACDGLCAQMVFWRQGQIRCPPWSSGCDHCTAWQGRACARDSWPLKATEARMRRPRSASKASAVCRAPCGTSYRMIRLVCCVLSLPFLRTLDRSEPDTWEGLRRAHGLVLPRRPQARREERLQHMSPSRQRPGCDARLPDMRWPRSPTSRA